MKNIFLILITILLISCHHRYREIESIKIENFDKAILLINKNALKLPLRNNASGYDALYMDKAMIIGFADSLNEIEKQYLMNFLKDNSIEAMYYYNNESISFEFRKKFHLLYYLDQTQLVHCPDNDMNCKFVPSSLNKIIKEIRLKNGWRYYVIHNKIGKPS